MKKIVVLALSFLLLLAFASGCTGKGADPGGQGSGTGGGSFEETGTALAAGGTTDYTIVLPENADSWLNTAASELADFIEASSGAALATVTEDGLTYDEDAHYISLGGTELFAASGLTLPDSLGQGGYILKTRGNLLFCNANNSFAVLCGVYDLLSYTIGFEAYADDEIYYETMQTVPLYKFDVEFVPTVATRTYSYYHLNNNSTYRMRMKLQSNSNLWVMWAHTTISQLLPLSTYQAAHQDWYGNTGGKQVCYTNEEMRAEMVVQIESRLEKNTTASYIMIGQEDNNVMCTCEKCSAAMEQFGGYAGLQLDFINKVAADVDLWLEANQPGRVMRYAIFAYGPSQTPPVTYNAAEDRYDPVYEDVEVRDNVFVLYCPINADFNQPLSAPVNISEYEDLRGWSELMQHAGTPDNLIVWTYSLPVYSMMIPISNFGMSGDHYKTMADFGVQYIYDQGATQTGIPGFEALKIYTQSKQMYNASLSYNELAKDFITHYYGAAGDAVWTYFNFLRSYYEYLEETKGLSGSIHFNLEESSLWSYSVLQQMMDYIDEGIAAIEPLRVTDPDRHTVLYDRLKREKLVPIWLMFRLYFNALTQAEKEEYLADLETYTVKFDIFTSRESSYDVADIIAQWRAQIYA